MQYKNPANYDIVYKALCQAGRRDLIGFGPKCLIPPRRLQGAAGTDAAAPRRQIAAAEEDEAQGYEGRK